MVEHFQRHGHSLVLIIIPNSCVTNGAKISGQRLRRIVGIGSELLQLVEAVNSSSETS